MLHIDIETFSSVDLKKAGLYKYAESPDFEILLIAYAFNDEPVKIFDMTEADLCDVKSFFYSVLKRGEKFSAHNAMFERTCLKRIGIDIPVPAWDCSMVKAAYCGLPLSLQQLSDALELEGSSKDLRGKNLIKYFSMPCKPTKANGGRGRNYPGDDPGKWSQYKEYCRQDVIAERAVANILEVYPLPAFEKRSYRLDQLINDRGVNIDLKFVKKAIELDAFNSEALSKEMQDLTNLDNPNSLTQLKNWLSPHLGYRPESLTKETIPLIIEETDSEIAKKALGLRLKASRASLKKYKAMQACACEDSRARGLFQFYGASTGRWAGRLIQLHNLPQTHLQDLDIARRSVLTESACLLYENISEVLSQLVRTSFTALKNDNLAIADFSAIEARVLSWLAGEKWRLDVFKKDGKIYEASAARMFKVPVELVTKDSTYRQKGKIAELALGYQGSVGALKAMGGEKLGLGENQMRDIVNAWRKQNPSIVKMWYDIQAICIKAVRLNSAYTAYGLRFSYDQQALRVKLPSGRDLFYWQPCIAENRFGGQGLKYRGLDATKKWGYVETYGGRIVENIVQAVSRDLLAYAMQRANSWGFDIVMHVHDEIICEGGSLEKLKEIMSCPPEWAKGLPLSADGFISPYYKK